MLNCYTLFTLLTLPSNRYYILFITKISVANVYGYAARLLMLNRTYRSNHY